MKADHNGWLALHEAARGGKTQGVYVFANVIWVWFGSRNLKGFFSPPLPSR
jgi:hypothetical protein